MLAATNIYNEQLYSKDANLYYLYDLIIQLKKTNSELELNKILSNLIISNLFCDSMFVGLADFHSDYSLKLITIDARDNRTYRTNMEEIFLDGMHNQLLHMWEKHKNFIFNDNPYTLNKIINSPLNLRKKSNVRNVVYDACYSGGSSEVCFICLVNVESKLLHQYRLLVNVILPYLNTTLNYINHSNQIADSSSSILSKRETEILYLIKKGVVNKRIASELNISINTVKAHIYNIFKKLSVTNRMQALIRAEKEGFLG